MMGDQEFEFTRGEMIRGSVMALCRRAHSRRSLFLQAFAILTMTLASTLYFAGDGWTPVHWLLAIAMMTCLIAVLHLLLVLFAAWWGGWLLARHPHLRHRFLLNVSPEGVRFTGQNGDWTHVWTDFTDMVEGRDLFTLMLGPGMFMVLPKRVLDGADMAAIRTHAPRR